MKVIVAGMPGSHSFSTRLSEALSAALTEVDVHRFPDGESLPRFSSSLEGRDVVLVAHLQEPDARIVSLLFAARTAREAGAQRVFLCAPYLPYMRQDTTFRSGEGVTAKYFADLLSSHFDGLVTVDPHLHRFNRLSEIYSMPTRVVHAATAIATWAEAHVDSPVFVGPDSESKQWVAGVATRMNAPFLNLDKVRSSDVDVTVSAPRWSELAHHTPVIVDDIISTGHTMIEAVRRLADLGYERVYCVGIHAVFAPGALEALEEVGARVFSANTIPHSTNRENTIDVIPHVARALRELY